MLLLTWRSSFLMLRDREVGSSAWAEVAGLHVCFRNHVNLSELRTMRKPSFLFLPSLWVINVFIFLAVERVSSADAVWLIFT